MFQPESYRKFLLNRATATQPITEYIEGCLVSNDEGADHAFHKIMVLHFADKDVNLFNIISEYFGSYLVPVQYQTQNIMTTFYTSNLKLILKIIKLDFIFPYNRNMYNIDILFNDKTSVECFGSKMTVDDIVSSVITRRFNENYELNLSDLCNDPEFLEHKVYFYKLSLLTNYKLLMIRMGQNTKLLNLSNNKISQIPQEILNFFIKGGLVAINFSNNLIQSLSELQRVNSRIEKLWLEGNPLCEELDAASYIKQLILKFPRLKELDGIRLNHHGVMLPFYQNYLVTPDRRTKIVVEKFITLYFAHFDSPPKNRDKLAAFYADDVHLSISADLSDTEHGEWDKVYQEITRNILRKPLRPNAKVPDSFNTKVSALQTFRKFPATIHDLSSFSVDVVLHNKKHLIIIVDGVFREISTEANASPFKKRHLSFRRTFLLSINYNDVKNTTSKYVITKEMWALTTATPDQVQNFKEPVRNLDSLALVNPGKDDIAKLCMIFMHITQQKNMEICEQRLKASNWDLKDALQQYEKDVQSNVINLVKMNDDDDFSDISSLLEDEID